MARSSSISSRLFGGGQVAADIAALKEKIESQQAELTTLKTSGAGVNQDALALSLKPLEDKITDAKNIAIANDNKISNIENVVPSRDELTLAVADLPKKADKTALESLSTTVSGINTAISENVTAINTELTALKTSDTAFDSRITALEARKEIKENKVITVLMDGNTRPGGSQASGFVHDGSGVLAGGTSFNAWQAVAETVSQIGLPGDVYEISAGFSSAASFGSITFNINGNRRAFTQAGIQAGTLPMVEFNDGNWRGVTITVTGDFTGDVTYVGFNGAPTYIPSIVKRTRIDGYSVDGNKISPTTELAALDARIAAIEAIL